MKHRETNEAVGAEMASITSRHRTRAPGCPTIDPQPPPDVEAVLTDKSEVADCRGYPKGIGAQHSNII